MSAKNEQNRSVLDVFGTGKKSEVKASSACGGECPSTYIAPSMEIEGNIRAKGDVEIAGALKGDVFSEGTVTVRAAVKGNISAKMLHIVDCLITGDITATGAVIVTENGTVNGNIRAKSLSCAGKVTGDVSVDGNLALDASASIIGKVSAATMIVARGAVIKGNVEMRQE